MELAGKVALVTGGAVRLGRAIALGLAGRGAAVGITYHSSAADADRVVAELRGLGREAAAVRCDQSRDDQVGNAVAAVRDSLGGIDVLVNNAGVFHRASFDQVDETAWDLHLDVNLKGPFLFARHAAPHLRASGQGRIVNLVDVAGFRP